MGDEPLAPPAVVSDAALLRLPWSRRQLAGDRGRRLGWDRLPLRPLFPGGVFFIPKHFLLTQMLSMTTDILMS